MEHYISLEYQEDQMSQHRHFRIYLPPDDAGCWQVERLEKASESNNCAIHNKTESSCDCQLKLEPRPNHKESLKF